MAQEGYRVPEDDPSRPHEAQHANSIRRFDGISCVGLESATAPASCSRQQSGLVARQFKSVSIGLSALWSPVSAGQALTYIRLRTRQDSLPHRERAALSFSSMRRVDTRTAQAV